LKLYAPPAVRKNAYAHTIATLRGTCRYRYKCSQHTTKYHIKGNDELPEKRGLEKYRVDKEDTVAKHGYFSHVLKWISAKVSKSWERNKLKKEHAR
jgi:hypothetical protein